MRKKPANPGESKDSNEGIVGCFGGARVCDPQRPGILETFRFIRTASDYSDFSFLEGRAATAILGMSVSLDAGRTKHFQQSLNECVIAGSQTSTLDECYASFQRAIEAVTKLCDLKEITDRLPSPSAMSFQGLKQLLEHTRLRKAM